jgi:hypothetical protein
VVATTDETVVTVIAAATAVAIEAVTAAGTAVAIAPETVPATAPVIARATVPEIEPATARATAVAPAVTSAADLRRRPAMWVAVAGAISAEARPVAVVGATLGAAQPVAVAGAISAAAQPVAADIPATAAAVRRHSPVDPVRVRARQVPGVHQAWHRAVVAAARAVAEAEGEAEDGDEVPWWQQSLFCASEPRHDFHYQDSLDRPRAGFRAGLHTRCRVDRFRGRAAARVQDARRGHDCAGAGGEGE